MTTLFARRPKLDLRRRRFSCPVKQLRNVAGQFSAQKFRDMNVTSDSNDVENFVLGNDGRPTPLDGVVTRFPQRSEVDARRQYTWKSARKHGGPLFGPE